MLCGTEAFNWIGNARFLLHPWLINRKTMRASWIQMFLGFCLCGSSILFGKAWAQVPTAEARVIFFRQTGAFKSATTCKLYHEQELIARIGNNSAWVGWFPTGEQLFQTVMSLDKPASQPEPMDLQGGKAYLAEIKLRKQGKDGLLPSAGYAFVLVPVADNRWKAVLRRKSAREAVKEALLEELLRGKSIR